MVKGMEIPLVHFGVPSAILSRPLIATSWRDATGAELALLSGLTTSDEILVESAWAARQVFQSAPDANPLAEDAAGRIAKFGLIYPTSEIPRHLPAAKLKIGRQIGEAWKELRSPSAPGRRT
jgi:hypothetical protein